MAIPLSSQFSLNTALPIEVSLVSADITARNAIAGVKRFDGMVTYLLSTNETWQLQGGVTNSDWVLISGGGFTPTLLQHHLFVGDATNVAVDGGTGVQFDPALLKFSIGGVDIMSIDGTPLPSNIQVHASGQPAVAELHSFGSGLSSIYYTGYANGTFASPTIATNGNLLGIYGALGYNGTDYSVGGYMAFQVNGTPTATAMPTDFHLYLAPTGSTTGVQRIFAGADGDFNAGDVAGIGNSTQIAIADSTEKVTIGNTNAFFETDGVTAYLKGWITGNQSLLINADNTFAGYGAGASITTGTNNVAYGIGAGAVLEDGIKNVFIGEESGQSAISDNLNTCVGYQSGLNLTGGMDYNTFIGALTDSVAGGSQGIAIGYGAITRRSWAVIGGDIAGDGIGEVHTLLWGKGDVANDPSVTNTTYDLRNTDYNDGIVTDGAGGIMRFMHGNTTGTGAFGMYQFMGTISNDTTGDTPNERVLFEQKQGTSRVTTDATVVNGTLIDALPDGVYNIHFKISCAEIAGSNWATIEVQNGFDISSGTLSTSDPDTVETHGTSTFTDPSTGVAFEIRGGGTGLGFKLRGVAATDINWTIAWEITYAPH